jgi:hypothetical protein
VFHSVSGVVRKGLVLGLFACSVLVVATADVGAVAPRSKAARLRPRRPHATPPAHSAKGFHPGVSGVDPPPPPPPVGLAYIPGVQAEPAQGGGVVLHPSVVVMNAEQTHKLDDNDLVTHVGAQAVSSPADLDNALAPYAGTGTPAPLLVYDSNGQLGWVTFNLLVPANAGAGDGTDPAARRPRAIRTAPRSR